jgi:hypothetical protein
MVTVKLHMVCVSVEYSLFVLAYTHDKNKGLIYMHSHLCYETSKQLTHGYRRNFCAVILQKECKFQGLVIPYPSFVILCT